MLIYEYEAKSLLKKHGFPLLESVIVKNSVEAQDAAELLSSHVVVKSQILSGGRGKRGLVKLSNSLKETEEISKELFNREDLKEGKIKRLLIEKAADIKNEIYLGALIDRNTKSILVMISLKGGVEIEEVAKEDPDAIAQLWLPFSTTGLPYLFNEALDSIKVEGKLKVVLASMLSKLVITLRDEDLTLLEINPFAITKDEKPLALDARAIIDESSLYRHPDQAEFLSLSENIGESEREAKEADIAFVKLEGHIGTISCGAGLSMTTCDVITSFGGKAANFLDVGGGASPKKVEAALNIILNQPEVKGVLINVFGGITRCDEVAHGVIASLEKRKDHVPIVIRLIGTNDVEGVKILSEHGFDAFTEMEPAIKKIVDLVKKSGGNK